MTRVLRPYQERAIADTLAALDRLPVLVMPTGAGKTFTAVEMIRRLGRPTLWLAHRRELIQQAAQHLLQHGLDVGIVMAGVKRRPSAPVQVASIQTLARREPIYAGLVVLDECHHARAGSYRRIIDPMVALGSAIVGLTATPFRLDGQGLGDIFGEIVVGAYTDDLVRDGTLIEPVVYAPGEAPDLRGVRTTRGDYDTDALGLAMDRATITGDIVDHWLRLSPGRKTVVFAVNIAHSRHICEQFARIGVRAEHLDGATAAGQRDGILYRLRTGYTTVVSNCAVLGEGWDLPALSTLVIARPTQSLNLHLQMLGRVMRAAEGKQGATVLDHAGNHQRLGTVMQRLQYSLGDGAVEQCGEREHAGPAVRRCPQCFLLSSRSAIQCPGCGAELGPEAPTTAPGELVPFAAPARERPSLDVQQAAWDALEAQRQARGFRDGWSFHRFAERFGFRPLVHEGRVCDPETVGPHVKAGIHARLLAVARERGYKPGWAAYQYRSIFGVWPRRTA